MAANGGQASLGVTIAGFSLVIGNVVQISGPNLSGTDVDVTELGNIIKQFVPGRVDPGEVTIGLRYVETNADHILADLVGGATVQVFTITIPAPNASTFVFTGYLKGFNMEVPEDGAIDNEITIKVTGDTVPTIA